MCLDRRRLSVGIALLGVSMPLYAVDLGSDMFSLRGYGTIGAMHSSYDLADFKTDASAPKGAGRSQDWSFGGMTKLGLQLDAFYSKVTGKDAAQLRAYWSQLIFTGKAKPPKSVPDSNEVRKLICANPNMIGYIDKGAVDASVKVVFTP